MFETDIVLIQIVFIFLCTKEETILETFQRYQILASTATVLHLSL